MINVMSFPHTRFRFSQMEQLVIVTARFKTTYIYARYLVIAQDDMKHFDRRNAKAVNIGLYVAVHVQKKGPMEIGVTRRGSAK